VAGTSTQCGLPLEATTPIMDFGIKVMSLLQVWNPLLKSGGRAFFFDRTHKMTLPITVPAPVADSAATNTPTKDATSSGVDAPMAINVAPATE
jgi:hypothetical protein